MEVTHTILIFDVIALVGIMIASTVYLHKHKFH